MTIAIKLPAAFKNHTVIQYQESNGTTTYEVLDSKSTPSRFVKVGEVLESHGEKVGTIFVFKEDSKKQ